MLKTTAARFGVLLGVYCGVASTASVANTEQPLSLQRLFAEPTLSGTPPRALSYAPDGSRITYLKGHATDANRLDLWQYHIATGQHSVLVDSASLFSGVEVLSDEEKARRERLRLFASGIVSYSWSKDGKALLFPLNGDLYYFDLTTKQSRKLTNTPEFETDGQISPQGKYVSFVREQNVFVVELATGEETQLTKDGQGTIKNGMAEFVAQEEMARMTGYWWAPDDSQVAYIQFDDSGVPEAMRNEIYADEIKLVAQRYPYAGAANVQVKLGVVSVKQPSTRWIDLGTQQDFYLPRVQWTQQPDLLTYQWQSRNQQQLELRLVNVNTLSQKTLLTETSATWLNLHDDLHFLKNSNEFIWASERDGFKHLYLYDLDGRLKRQLTSGEWVVDKLEAVNEQAGEIYFSGRKDTVLESHLYRTNLNAKQPVRLTSANAHHSVVVAKDGSGFLDSFSSVSQLPKVHLNNRDGKTITVLADNSPTGEHPIAPYWSQLIQPRFGTLTAKDGQTLHYRIFEPRDRDPAKKYPVIVSVYGGPVAQRVTNSWSGRDLYLHYMAQRGYIVFQLDNRGSAYRGKKFEDPIYLQLGQVEIDDQITGVEYLRSLPYVDAGRIGIYGHSYGGYLAIMAMFKAGDYFKAGVSGAPVTDWSLYDTHYTERYLGHPATNAAGYLASSVFPYVKDYKGELLIYHGMADDNVLFTNSTKLFSELQQQGKMFDMMTYPGSKHAMFGQSVQTHLHQTITAFFDRTLQPQGREKSTGK